MKRIIVQCVDPTNGKYRAIAEGTADEYGLPYYVDSYGSSSDAIGRLIWNNAEQFDI